MSGLLAIDAWVKDVAIPLLGAALTAAGIVIPLLLQRRRERREEVLLFEKALRALHRDATLLVEHAQLLVAKSKTGDPVTDEDIAGISSTRERLFQRLFDDPRVYDAYFSSESWMTQKAGEKLLLLLGEIDVRLRRLQTTRAIDLFTMFGLYLLQYGGEQDPEERASLKAAMDDLRGANSEIKKVSSAIFPDWD